MGPLQGIKIVEIAGIGPSQEPPDSIAQVRMTVLAVGRIEGTPVRSSDRQAPARQAPRTLDAMMIADTLTRVRFQKGVRKDCPAR